MDPTLDAVKTAIETQNRAFEDFKRTNDARLAAIDAKGVADPLLATKLDKLEKDIAASSAIVDAFAAMEAKVNALALNGGTIPTTTEAEVKAFNHELRSNAHAQGRTMPALVSADEFRAYKKEFEILLRRGAEAIDRKAMSVGSDPDGGYLVTPAVSAMIVKRIYDTSPVEQIAGIETIGTDKLEGLRDIDEASGGGWVSEVGSRATTTSPQFGKWQIEVHEQYENPGATQKLLDDASINVEAWLSGKVADKLSRRRNTAFVVGTGVGQPRGFASYTTAATADLTRAWGVLEHVATGTNGSFGTNPNGADKLIDLVHKIKPHFRQNATFCLPRITLGAARQLKDAGVRRPIPATTSGSRPWRPASPRRCWATASPRWKTSWSTRRPMRSGSRSGTSRRATSS
jgi:HK97 family phage major capsid protein